MTSPWGNPPQLPKPPHTWPASAPEATRATLTVVGDPLCGHLPGECEDPVDCAYWRGVALGEYPAPDAYLQPVTLPPHAAGLLPLTDPALDGAA